MSEIEFLPPREEEGRTWLPVRYKGKEILYTSPPLRGTHRECFSALHQEQAQRPAFGIEIALLAAGAYGARNASWNFLRDIFVSSYLRAPYRFSLLPRGSFQEDRALSGVLIEQDFEGRGIGKIVIPELSGWIERDKILYSPDGAAVFVPRDAYHGIAFENDGIARACLTPEGAALFAKTARDAGKTLYNWIAQRMNKIKQPEQRVSILEEYCGRLVLDSYDWCDDRYYRAFGVFCAAGARKLFPGFGKEMYAIGEKREQRAPLEVKSKSGLMPGREQDIEVSDGAETYVPATEITSVLSEIEQGGKITPEARELIKRRLLKEREEKG